MVTTNYMNHDLVVNGATSNAEKSTAREENPALLGMMLEEGDRLTGVGDSAFFGVPSVTQAGGNVVATAEGLTLEQVFMYQTLLYRQQHRKSLQGVLC